MKAIEFIKKWIWQILAALFFILFIGKGCTSTKISKANKNIDDLEHKIDSLSSRLNQLEKNSLTDKKGRDMMEKVMLDFLIYEDDLDKGKTSLSQIKNKIESND
jgi:cell division protein FtsL